MSVYCSQIIDGYSCQHQAEWHQLCIDHMPLDLEELQPKPPDEDSVVLPSILYKVQRYLIDHPIQLAFESGDGRINSCLDESLVVKQLIRQFGSLVQQPKIRMWYDVLLLDSIWGWIPVNIKTTTMKTHDNIGNLASCVHAYTDTVLDLQRPYQNGELSDILFRKLQCGQYNFDTKKDYYFIVLNKTDASDVVINSLRGLTILTPNTNNLPFQICWNKNRTVRHTNIHAIITQFVHCVQKPKCSWRETFLTNMRSLVV